jgi:hypothetical protein
VDSTHPDSNLLFDVNVVYLWLIIFSVLDDICIDNETSFDRLRESKDQTNPSFEGTYTNRVYIYIFIGVSVHLYINICVCDIRKKITTMTVYPMWLLKKIHGRSCWRNRKHTETTFNPTTLSRDQAVSFFFDLDPEAEWATGFRWTTNLFLNSYHC